MLLFIGWIRRFRSTQRQAVSLRQRWVLAAAGCALAVHFGAWIGSLEYTSVAVSTLLVATAPIWTALYDTFVHRRPLSRVSTVAFVAGAIGLIVVVAANRTPAPHPGSQALGIALALAGGMAIGIYLLFVRSVRAGLDTRAIVTHTYSWAALVLVAAALAARQPPPSLHAGSAWAGILAMAVISQLIGHTAMNASLRWFTPSAVSFATLLEPVIAAVLALLIFGESLSPVALGGAAVVLVAIGFVLREERMAPDWLLD